MVNSNVFDSQNLLTCTIWKGFFTFGYRRVDLAKTNRQAQKMSPCTVICAGTVLYGETPNAVHFIARPEKSCIFRPRQNERVCRWEPNKRLPLWISLEYCHDYDIKSSIDYNFNAIFLIAFHFDFGFFLSTCAARVRAWQVRKHFSVIADPLK